MKEWNMQINGLAALGLLMISVGAYSGSEMKTWVAGLLITAAAVNFKASK